MIGIPNGHPLTDIVSPVLVAQIRMVFTNVVPPVIKLRIVPVNKILQVCPGVRDPTARPVCPIALNNADGNVSKIYTPDTVLPPIFP
jgi:hypothetical protein